MKEVCLRCLRLRTVKGRRRQLELCSQLPAAVRAGTHSPRGDQGLLGVEPGEVGKRCGVPQIPAGAWVSLFCWR